MAMVKCPHCPARVRPKQILLHLKKCIIKRRKDKAAGSAEQRAIYAKDQERIDAEVLAEKKAELESKELELAKQREALAQAEQLPTIPKPTTKKGTKK